MRNDSREGRKEDRMDKEGVLEGKYKVLESASSLSRCWEERLPVLKWWHQQLRGENALPLWQ